MESLMKEKEMMKKSMMNLNMMRTILRTLKPQSLSQMKRVRRKYLILTLLELLRSIFFMN